MSATISESKEEEPRNRIKTAIDLLRQIGCTLGQGYHFSRPLPAEELEPLWANGLKIGSNWRQRLAG